MFIDAEKEGYNIKPKYKISAEHRAKMSASLKGRKHSAETRAKISAGNKGKKRGKCSAEHRKKLSEAAKGKKRGKYSAETRKKHLARPRLECDRCKQSFTTANYKKHRVKCLTLIDGKNEAEWSLELGLSPHTIAGRIKKWGHPAYKVDKSN